MLQGNYRNTQPTATCPLHYVHCSRCSRISIKKIVCNTIGCVQYTFIAYQLPHGRFPDSQNKQDKLHVTLPVAYPGGGSGVRTTLSELFRALNLKSQISTAVYFQKFSFYFTFSGKPWDPPVKNSKTNVTRTCTCASK